MDRRLKLQKLLESILQSDNVYFQPPPSIKLHYPCIIYTKSDINQIKADNKVYIRQVKYTVTLIGRELNSELVDKILNIPYCSYDRLFISDSLYHDVFNLFY